MQIIIKSAQQFVRDALNRSLNYSKKVLDPVLVFDVPEVLRDEEEAVRERSRKRLDFLQSRLVERVFSYLCSALESGDYYLTLSQTAFRRTSCNETMRSQHVNTVQGLVEGRGENSSPETNERNASLKTALKQVSRAFEPRGLTRTISN